MGTKKKIIISIIILFVGGLAIGGAYFGWQYWQAQQAPAVAETPESTEPIVNPEIDYDRINNLADEINAARGEQE